MSRKKLRTACDRRRQNAERSTTPITPTITLKIGCKTTTVTGLVVCGIEWRTGKSVVRGRKPFAVWDPIKRGVLPTITLN